MARVDHITFNVQTDDYTTFIEEFRNKLANHFPDDPNRHDDVYPGHPLLPTQNGGRVPERWIFIKLEADGRSGKKKKKKKKKATATVAVRGDNVYLVGFMNREEHWFELGLGRKTDKPRFPGSTFLGCDVKYRSLVGGPVKRNLTQLELGKRFATEAVRRLSPHSSGEADPQTRKALAGLIVMLCESARMFSHQETVYGPPWSTQQGFPLPPGAAGGRGRGGGRQHRHRGRRGVRGTMPWQRQAAGGLGVLHAVGTSNRHWQAAVPVEHPHRRGKRMVEVFDASASFDVVGDIAVFDGVRGQIIYDNRPDDDGATSSMAPPVRDSQGCLLLTGPYRAISAAGCVSIEVDLFSPGTGHGTAGKLLWDCYDVGNHGMFYDWPTTQTINTSRGDIDVTYAVLSNAVEASVEVKLLPAGYGAANPADILLHDQEVVVTGPDYRVPLARSVVAVPLDRPLVTQAKLQASDQAGADFTPIDYSFHLDPMLCAETEERLGEYDGIKVQVTWSLDF
ncbi:hypothetical protein QOZ80_9BG0699670 [Eleusine coracana subsp. coracana]|nr:hypothetical protein QOZ80_9BG0699670 [Eleusine coracana subsp. coracana]